MNPMSQASITPQWIAQTLGLKSPALTEPFSSIVTDSRKVISQCLFVALPGEKFDGHQFIEAAIQKGARGILAKKGFPSKLPSLLQESVTFFEVEDPIKAYREIASAWRKNFLIPVIVVAGSVGKTTTKEILTAILRGKWPETLKTAGSQNGFLGIPMTLLELRSTHRAAVIEIGIDEPGAMQQHLEIVQPTAAILTAIGPEHLEKLVDLPTVAREEKIALSFTAQSGPQSHVIAVHLDDPWIRPCWDEIQSTQKFGYTFDPSLKTEGVFLGTWKAGTTENPSELLEVNGTNFHELFQLPLLGKHNAHNTLGAIVLALGLGLTPDEIRNGLKTFEGAEGRSEIKTLPGGTTVICDYYNAQPASMAAGIDLLAQLGGHPSHARWACLGDMLEMGLEEERLHRELASALISHKIENVLLYGTRMRFLEDELKNRGFRGFFRTFTSHTELTEELLHRLQPQDILLIKGSRGMKMEEVWKVLLTKTQKALILTPTPQTIATAAEAIKRNAVIGMPTETVYGLAGNAFSLEALTQIFQTKERPTFDPLIVHVCLDNPTPSLSELEQLHLVDGNALNTLARKRADVLIQKFWPGPLTLVLPKAPQVPDLVTSGLPSVAIRMPRHPVAQALIRECKTPLAAPSANRFGRISPTTASAVFNELGDRIELILDGGPCEVGVESTVIQLGTQGEVTLLRPGGISIQQLQEILLETGLTEIPVRTSTSSPTQAASSPGMLDQHYAPSQPLILLPATARKTSASVFHQLCRHYSLKKMSKIGLLLISGNAESAAQYFSSMTGAPTLARSLSPSGDLAEAARNLFAELRFLDQAQVDVIFSEHCLIQDGLGHAIEDRLARAALKRGK